jgi:hypothetical protein
MTFSLCVNSKLIMCMSRYICLVSSMLVKTSICAIIISFEHIYCNFIKSVLQDPCNLTFKRIIENQHLPINCSNHIQQKLHHIYNEIVIIDTIVKLLPPSSHVNVTKVHNSFIIHLQGMNQLLVSNLF